jgi:hypothetical protein
MADTTLRLVAANTPAKASVAGQVSTGIALQAGLGPLAAYRLGRAIAQVAAASPAEIVLIARRQGDAMLVEISGGDAEWCRLACALLSGQDAVEDAGAIRLRLARPPLVPVEDV